MTSARDETELRELARLHVRAGLRNAEGRLAAMVTAVETQMPGTDARIMARAWLTAAERELVVEAAAWEVPTDHERLTAALAECEQRGGVAVLAGVDDPVRVRARVEAAEVPLRGVLWFGEAAVWHAVTHGLLEMELRRGNGAAVGADDPLAAAVVACLARHGVRGRWQGQQLEALVRWNRRP